MRLLRALTILLGTCFGVALLTFFVLHLVPGDPIDLLLGENATPASRELLYSQLGLNLPLHTQIFLFFKGLLHGDLGTSIALREPVSSLIARHFPYTALLAFCATLLGNTIGIPLGVLSSSRRGILLFSILLLAIPTFWLGPLLVLAFSLHWPWLPVSSFSQAQGIILPSLTLGLGISAALIQTTRAAVLNVSRTDFIRTAHAKGAGQMRVLFVHALPNAAAPILSVSILQFAHLLAGAVITETIFDWPGLGKLLMDAVLQRDYPLVQGIVLFTTFIYVMLNTFTDFILKRRQS